MENYLEDMLRNESGWLHRFWLLVGENAIITCFNLWTWIESEAYWIKGIYHSAISHDFNQDSMVQKYCFCSTWSTL